MAASYQFIGQSREGGNPVRTVWFPAFAGMTDNSGDDEQQQGCRVYQSIYTTSRIAFG